MAQKNTRHRKVTPGVKNGRVQKKNRHAPTPTYWNTPQPVPVIDKESPGSGYRHFLKKKDILSFIEILPEWNKISHGLNAIVLAPGDENAFGYHTSTYGVIEICAWPREMWIETTRCFIDEHEAILKKLDVPYVKQNDYWISQFDAPKIRAFQLLHIFLHELGHHYDKITTKRKENSSRGEGYAEEYANTYTEIIWSSFLERFSLY